MVNISDLAPGMTVKIVDAWLPNGECWENSDGLMDKWLGQIMTIQEVVDNEFVCMVEDEEDEYGGH